MHHLRHMAKSIERNASVIVRLSLFTIRIKMNRLFTLLPPDSVSMVSDLVSSFDNLTISIVSPRKRKLGDYCKQLSGTHRITLNENLPPYAMLIVLVHELAHLKTRLIHGKNVTSHGKEWKAIYSNMLKEFIYKNIFPQNIAQDVMLHAQKPCACFPKTLDKLRQE